MPLLDRDDSLLLVIDAQESFYGPTRSDVDPHDLYRSFDRAGWLVAVAAALDVPMVVTEEESEHNGATDLRLSRHLPDATPVLPKRYFGAPDNPEIMDAIIATGRTTAVVVGLETDVCVCHTSLLLLERGFRVAVAADCLYSPGPSHDAGLTRMRDSGVEILTAKAVFYDWVRNVDELEAACESSEVVNRPPGFHL